MMKKLLNWLRKDESGQGMVEYGLIIALIAVVVIVALIALGPEIAKIFEGITSSIVAASPSAAT